MANPITWRNIAAPDFTGASDMMGKAQESFTGALDALGNTKDQFEQGRTDRNTQEFMAQMAQYRTPEELAAAQESGAIDATRQRLSGNGLINSEKTGADAVTSRLDTLFAREDKQRKRDDAEQGRQNSDSVRDLSNRILSEHQPGQTSDLATREKFLSSLPDDLSQAERLGVTQNFDQRLASRFTVTDKDRQMLAPVYDSFKQQGANNPYYNVNDGNIGEEMEALNQQFTRTDEDGNKQLLGISDGEDRQQITDAMRRVRAEGITIDNENRAVPKEVISATLSSMEDEGVLWDSVGDFEERLRTTMEDPFWKRQAQQAQQLKNSEATVRNNEYQILNNWTGSGHTGPVDLNAYLKMNVGQPSQQPQREPESEIDTGNIRFLNPGSVKDSPGATLRGDVVEGVSDAGRWVSDDWNNRNGLGVSANLNPNVEGSPANYVKQALGFWQDTSAKLGNPVDRFVTDAASPSIRPEQAEVVGRVQAAVQNGETPSTKDLAATVKLMQSNPDMFSDEGVQMLERLLQESL